jgi:hypothetical protein
LSVSRDGLLVPTNAGQFYLTPLDLLAAPVHDRAYGDVSAFGLGSKLSVLEGLVSNVGGTLRACKRARFAEPKLQTMLGDKLVEAKVPKTTTERYLAAAEKGAAYLLQNQQADGRFLYSVHAKTNAPIAGYNWPRHAGSAFFLAEAARAQRNELALIASRRSIANMFTSLSASCGGHVCLAESGMASVGTNALALLALTELATVYKEVYLGQTRALSAFLHSLVRPDGELMHFYDVKAQTAVDKQVPYYSGEAALALARASSITDSPESLDVAARIVEHLSHAAWSFPFRRYYVAEEHWTCQAADALEERGRGSEDAYQFCLAWLDVMHHYQFRKGEIESRFFGCHGVLPLTAPRMTPTASRMEALVSVLRMSKRRAARGDKAAGQKVLQLTQDLEAALGCLLRHQIDEPALGFVKEPDLVSGAFFGAWTDDELRIDYTQHAGAALLRGAQFSR